VEGDRCGQHKDAERAPRPDVVLYKFNINDRWRDRFMALGIKEKTRDVQADTAKHEAHAAQFGRDAHRYRQVADSGVPVFGEGLQGVSLFDLLKELPTVYEVVDIHIKPRSDGKPNMSVLVISFSNGKPTSANTEAFDELLRFLASSCWGFCHVWANPPQEDGRVIHTVNSSHREADQKAKQVLHFADGLWAVNPC
jgi:hypothetical protein